MQTLHSTWQWDSQDEGGEGSFLFPSVRHLEINEAPILCSPCKLMFSKWEMLFRGFPSLLSKDSLGFIAGLIQQVPTGERHPVAGRARRPGQSGCHSKALKVLTSSSYRCLVYTHFKSVYCDWPHPICWCCKALMVPNKGGRHTVPEMGKK